MEIHIISNFEAGVNYLQNPFFIYRFFAFPGIENGFRVYRWRALIFAILATFSGLIRRIKLIFIRLHTILPSPKQIQQIVISEDDDISLASSSDDERDDDEEEDAEESRPTTSFAGQQRFDEGFFAKGSLRLRNMKRRIDGGDGFDWSDFTSSENVVKLWDSLSSSFNFGMDFDDLEFDYVVSRWGFDQRRDSNGFLSRVSNIPAVIFTAEGNGKGDGVVMRGYDTRVRSRGRRRVYHRHWWQDIRQRRRQRGVNGGRREKCEDAVRELGETLTSLFSKTNMWWLTSQIKPHLHAIFIAKLN